MGKNFGKVAAARYSFGLVIEDACGSRPLMDISILVGIPVGVVRDMRAGRASYASREQHQHLAQRPPGVWTSESGKARSRTETVGCDLQIDCITRV